MKTTRVESTKPQRKIENAVDEMAVQVRSIPELKSAGARLDLNSLLAHNRSSWSSSRVVTRQFVT